MNPNDPEFPTALVTHQGVTVRLYIAAQIVAGIISNPGARVMPNHGFKSDIDAICFQSLELADALIAADREGK